MQEDELVPAKDFCLSHNIGISFIHSLQEYGLVETTTIEESIFIPVEKLGDIEKLVRLHYELNINMEGIDVITQLLKRIENLQEEMTLMRNRLRLYESSGTDVGDEVQS